MLAFLHVNSSSLNFLSAFRLFVDQRNAPISLIDYPYEFLVNSRILGQGEDGFRPIAVAPYCFNCGAYIDDIWTEEKALDTRESTERQKTFVCLCNMARYCSKDCASIHYLRHLETCYAPNMISSRSSN